MKDEVEELSKVLLEVQADPKKIRARAAEQLVAYGLDVRAFNALYSICSFPDVYAIDEGLLPIVGKSIGKILSVRDLAEDPLKHHPLNPSYFDAFHPEALEFALQELTDIQRETVCEFTISHPQSSKPLTAYAYKMSTHAAFFFQDIDTGRSFKNAQNAILLFYRLKKTEKNIQWFFYDIVMHIITGNRITTILPLFTEFLKNYFRFDSPESVFEKYRHFHILLLAKMASRDTSHLKDLIHQLKIWVDDNKPEDHNHVRVFELIAAGGYQAAYKTLEKLEEPKESNEQMLDFYKSWRLAVLWIIKQRVI